MGILYVYLTQWLAFFFILLMLFYSLDQAHAYTNFLNKLYVFCTSSSLEVNLVKSKHMKSGCNKMKFYLDKDQIEITHEYKLILFTWLLWAIS